MPATRKQLGGHFAPLAPAARFCLTPFASAFQPYGRREAGFYLAEWVLNNGALIAGG